MKVFSSIAVAVALLINSEGASAIYIHKQPPSNINDVQIKSKVNSYHQSQIGTTN